MTTSGVWFRQAVMILCHRVAQPCGGMHVGDARPTRPLCVTVCHRDHSRLLQTEHVIQVIGPPHEHGHLSRAGVAEHRIVTSPAQDGPSRLGDGLAAHRAMIANRVGWCLRFGDPAQRSRDVSESGLTRRSFENR